MRIFGVLSIALASCGGLADPLVEPTDAGSAAEARREPSCVEVVSSLFSCARPDGVAYACQHGVVLIDCNEVAPNSWCCPPTTGQVVEAAACPGDQIACTLERDEAGAEFAVLGEGGSCCYPQ